MFDRQYVGSLAKASSDHNNHFSEDEFMCSIFNKQWEDLELKQRMRRINDCYFEQFDSYPSALDTLMSIAEDFTGFPAMTFPGFVEVYGLDHYDISIEALHYFTRFSSSEFAIRPFIVQDEKKTMNHMLQWSKDENYHVRRLASEGCRPKLPWAMALPDFQKDPALILPILENLKNDSEEYVRKSVANNLNDISKDHPALVLSIAKKWKGTSKETDKLVKHACRTMLKAGDQKVLELFGLAANKGVKISNFKILDKKIRLGQSIQFQFDVSNSSKKPAILRLEYKVHYLKSNGTWSPKIFKISERTLAPGEQLSIKRKQEFKDLTTRKHYPGKHKIEPVFNGSSMGLADFELTK